MRTYIVPISLNCTSEPLYIYVQQCMRTHMQQQYVVVYEGIFSTGLPQLPLGAHFLFPRALFLDPAVFYILFFIFCIFYFPRALFLGPAVCALVCVYEDTYIVVYEDTYIVVYEDTYCLSEPIFYFQKDFFFVLKYMRTHTQQYLYMRTHTQQYMRTHTASST